MTQWFMGIKPGVGPVLKVLSDDTADPLTVPVADIFDSEQATRIGYVYDIADTSYSLTRWPKPNSNKSTAVHYGPPGTDDTTALEKVWTYRDDGDWQDGMQWHVIFPEQYGLSFTPWVETRVREANGRFVGPSTRFNTTDSLGSARTGQIVGGSTATSSYADSARVLTGGIVTVGRKHYSVFGHGYVVSDANTINVNYVYPQTSQRLTSVLELPAENQPFPTYASAPVDGQLVLELTNKVARMAYPGHDVNETSHEAFIFSESRIPAKIIGAGEVTVGAGGNAKVFTKRATTPETYMDWMIRRTADAFWCNPPYMPPTLFSSDGQGISIDYEVEADGVRIYNTGNADVVVRYMICADDASGPTSGGAKVLHDGNDGTQDFIQIKRPGSSDTNPNLNEIILDTRYPYVPIVQEGWVAAEEFTEGSDNRSFGAYRKTVNFINTGYMPFVKIMTRWSNGQTRSPINKQLRVSGVSGSEAAILNGQAAGDCTFCVVGDNFLRLYQSNGEPVRLELKQETFGPGIVKRWGPSLVGVRYYVFAIPYSL